MTTCKNGHTIQTDRDWIYESAGHGRMKRHCRTCRNLKQARSTKPAKSKERRAVQRANERARALGRQATLTGRQWQTILRDFDHQCAYCFAPYEHLEHRIALTDGGDTSATNVVPSCQSCNAKKHARTLLPSIVSRFWPPDQHLLATAKGGQYTQ